MSDALVAQLQAELASIDGEFERLNSRRRLLKELLDTYGSGSAPAAAPAPAPKAEEPRPAQRKAAAPKPRAKRRPRGLITNKVREYLGDQNEPVHATEILAFLDKNDAAPLSAKPMPTLQSTLQRMKEMGEIVNRGRNRWSLSGGGDSSDDAGSDDNAGADSSSDDGASSESAAGAAAAPAASTPLVTPPSPRPAVVTSTTTFGNRPKPGQ